MTSWEMLGAVGHRGGLVAVDPTLTIGIVHIVARTSGLEVELIARRPLVRRSAGQHSGTTRVLAATTLPAGRQLFLGPDEGSELRLGWRNGSGSPHWVYPDHSSGESGGDLEFGWSTRATYFLPPQFDTTTLVFSWPEIGFPDTTVTIALPDRLTASPATVPVWNAPLAASASPSWSTSAARFAPPRRVLDETGSVVAPPQVLLRDSDVVLLLTRLGAHDEVLRATLTGLARGGTADALAHSMFAHRGTGIAGGIDATRGGGPMIGLIDGQTLEVGQIDVSGTSAEVGSFETVSTWTVAKPERAERVRLGVAWPAAGLAATEIMLDVDRPW